MITIANMGYHTENELIYCSQQYLLRSLSTFGVTMNIVAPSPPPHLQIRSVLPSLCHLLIYLGVLVPSTTPSASPPSPQLFRLQQQPAGTVSYPSAPFPRKREADDSWSELSWLSEATRSVLCQWVGKKCGDWTHVNDYTVQYDGALAELMARPSGDRVCAMWRCEA